MSSVHIFSGVVGALLLAGVAAAISPQNSSPGMASQPRNGPPVASSRAAANPIQIFRQGQDALNKNQLDQAERDFRQVLALDPQAGGAYANLGVVYMRRKQWTKALETLRKAEHLLSQEPGIRLNIGLTYYRQNEFLKAIPSFRIRGTRSTRSAAATVSARTVLLFRGTVGGRCRHSGAALGTGVRPLELSVCALDRRSPRRTKGTR